MFELRNVRQYYRKKEYLKIDNLRLPNKGLVIIRGFNGSGKTTFLNLLLGLVKYEGDIYYRGKNIKELSNDIFKDICYVPQFSILFDGLSIRENLELNAYLKDEDNTFDENSKKIRVMSGGQRQKANLSRMYELSYSTYILDEPTSNLDRQGRLKLIEFLKKEKEDKLIIIATHDEDLISLGDYVYDISTINEIESSSDSYLDINISSKPKKIKLKLFKANIFLLIFKALAITGLMISMFILSVFYLNDFSKLNDRYIKESFSYCEIESEVHHDESIDDFKAINGPSNIIETSDGMPIVASDRQSLQLDKIYISNTSSNIIASDYFVEMFGDTFTLLFYGAEYKVVVDEVQKTNYLKHINDKNICDYTSLFLILSKDFIDSIDEKTRFSYVINTNDSMPNGYIFPPNFLFDTKLKIEDARMILNITLIPVSILLFLVLIYIYLYENCRTNKFYNRSNKLRIFSATKGYISVFNMLEDVSSIVISLLIGIGLEILAIRVANKSFNPITFKDLGLNLFGYDVLAFLTTGAIIIALLIISIILAKLGEKND